MYNVLWWFNAQIDEQGMQLRKYFLSLLDKGPEDADDDKENAQVCTLYPSDDMMLT